MAKDIAVGYDNLSTLTEGNAVHLIVDILLEMKPIQVKPVSMLDPLPTPEELAERKKEVERVLERALDNWCHKVGIDDT